MDALNPQNDLTNPPPPAAGHNQPDNINSVLARERAEALVKAADVWAGIVEIASAEQANRAKDTLDQLRAEWNKADAERKGEKKPHDDAALEVQRRWKPILSMIEACALPVSGLHTRWLIREDKRLKRERLEAQERAEAAQREAEAAARKAEQAKQAPVSAKLAAEEAAERARLATEAAAAIPDRARTAGSYGRPARSLREYWSAEVVDVLKAARHYRDKPELRACLASLASADARAGVRNTPEGQGIPGCNITSRKE